MQTRLSLTSKTALVASLSANAATSTTLNKKQMVKAIFKTKAKTKIKRIIDPAPLVNIGAAVTFEAGGMNVWRVKTQMNVLQVSDVRWYTLQQRLWIRY